MMVSIQAGGHEIAPDLSQSAALDTRKPAMRVGRRAP